MNTINKTNSKIAETPVIALAGNPNVGKSTVFNGLTGLKQHTGNWAGKTVGAAFGTFTFNKIKYKIIDLPGCYSLEHSYAEEQSARDFICFEHFDRIVLICDATSLKRGLMLCLQILQITDKLTLCINFEEEARKKGIKIDIPLIQNLLNVPVYFINAKNRFDINFLKKRLCDDLELKTQRINLPYPKYVTDALSLLEPTLKEILSIDISVRKYALALLCNDTSFISSAKKITGKEIECEEIKTKLNEIHTLLKEQGFDEKKLKDDITLTLYQSANIIYDKAVTKTNTKGSRDRMIDKILCGKYTSFPFMFIFFALIFLITLKGANYPSTLLGELFFFLEDKANSFFSYLGINSLLTDLFLSGVFRVTGWVISVMLPPMVIFFPLFALLEDFGYLPRIAFNLDGYFEKCNLCGKQALTMCMGFGCNAVGVSGCNIINGKRERLIAILTNSCVPCNGRFSLIIILISTFFFADSPYAFLITAVLFFCVIAFSVLSTFLLSKILSVSLVKGAPSSFVMELPPYRKPNIIKTVLVTLTDKTFTMLKRAVTVAVPAGAIIWCLSNIYIDNNSAITYICNFFDPFGRFLGMDGVIITAFIFSFPANEIVLPLILMLYLGNTAISDSFDTTSIFKILSDNGWTVLTATNVIVFSLLHWPCSTTLLTIHNETKSLKWTIVSVIAPTMLGITVCCAISTIYNIFFLII